MAFATEDTNPAVTSEPKLLAEYEVTEIRLIPSQVVFSDASEYRKVLVVGKTGRSSEIDLTRTAKFTPAADCVRFDEQGYLFPVKDCETRVAVAANGLTAQLPVTVRGLAKPREVSFVRDVEPIMNKVGCSAGTCHGAAKGKNGFKLSLRGYDPEFDYDRLIHDVSGRRSTAPIPLAASCC